jgi:hypothetical protein
MKRQLIALALTAVCAGSALSSPLVTANSALGAQEAGEEVSPEQRRLESYFRATRMALRDGPRDRFAIDAAAELAGKKPAEILAWVQRETDWVPYEGVLRGATGVLMDRLGNDWDRALLVAALCEQVEMKVRLATAPWTEEALVELEGRLDVGVAPMPEAAGLNAEKFAKDARLPGTAFESTTASLRWQREEASKRMAALVGTATQELLAALDVPEPGTDQEATHHRPSPGELHVWVQVETGEGWLDLDPIVREGRPGESPLTAANTLAPTEIDGALYHRLTLRAVAEGWTGTKREEHVLVELPLRWMDTVGESIDFAVAPISSKPTIAGARGSEDLTSYYKGLAKAETEWLPTFVFMGVPTSKMSVRCDGSANASPQTSTTGQAVGRAADAIGGLGKAGGGKREEFGYTAQWIELVSEGPELAPTVERRVIFDNVGEAARESGGERPDLDRADVLARNSRLLGSSHLLPLACDVSEQYISRLALYTLWLQKDFFERTANRQAMPAKELEAVLTELETFDALLWGMARSRQSWNPTLASYVSRGNLVIHHELPRLSETGELLSESGLDIVWNTRAGFDASANSFEQRLREGVIDTAAESVLIEAMKPEGKHSPSLAGFRGELRAVRKPESLKEATVGWPVDVAARMARDLEEGAVLVLPIMEVEGLNEWELAYWRVNPESGVCLGIGGQGWGAAVSSEMTERMVLQVFWISTIGNLAAFGKCMAGAADNAAQQACTRSALCNSILILASLGSLGPVAAAAGAAVCGVI